MPDHVIDLSLGASGAALTVVFGRAAAEVRGVVRDEKGPVAGAAVVMRNPSISMNSSNGSYSSITREDGSYRFANVPAGRYVLLAADEGDANLMNDNFEDYEDVLENVELRGDEKIVKDLKRHARR
jgi:hypothetical protein